MPFLKITNYVRQHQKLMAIVIGVFFVFGNLVISNNTRKQGERFVFWSDAMGYYVYLPSVFIHHDLNVISYGNVCKTTGNPVNKYTSGVATLQMPFFLLAHSVASLTGDTSDGFSETYEFCITMGTITYAYLGLLLMFLVLLRYVRKSAAFLSVLTIYWGTNLYYYTIGESGMSHAYSFFVISWFIWALHYFIEKPNWKNSLQMGIAIGLAVLIRPTNILIAIFPFMLDLESMKEIGNRILFFMRQPYTYLSIVVAFLAWVPQLIYWKIQTGYFLYYSYSDETFEFLANPHIGDVLFGNVAGLFTYSPLLLLIIPGLFVMAKKKKLSTAIGISVIFLFIIYLNSSWWIPTFDCSFGHRAFIEYFPLFTIPIAFFFHAFFANIRAIIISVILILFFFVNIRIAYLYKKYPCWKAEWGYSWTWDNVAYIVRVAFFVDPPPSQHFRAIEKKEPLPKI